MSAPGQVQKPGGGGAIADRHYQQRVASLEGTLKQYGEYKAEYHDLQQTLRELPDEIEQEAMVPVGPLAFFPGKLVSTNEILVLLGDNWFVERSAKQAADIAGRREDYIDGQIAQAAAELADLKKQRERGPKDLDIAQLLQGATVNEDGEEFVDIKETLTDGQQPEFEEQATNNDGGQPDVDVAAALEEKRQRMIRSLETGAELDRSQLSEEQRKLLELLDQIEDDEDGAESSQDPDSHDEDDEGDAYSDDDRAIAVRDDDEDDFNNGDLAASSSSDEEGAGANDAERPAPAPSGLPAGSPQSSPRGILKPPTTPLAHRVGHRAAKKSVSFGAATAALEAPSQGVTANDVDEVARRLGLMDTSLRTAQPEDMATQPLRSMVVEKLPSSGEATLDMADSDMHAREIAQVYNRKRFQRMSAGMFDGAHAAAERILAGTKGVTLVDATEAEDSGVKRAAPAPADEPELVSLDDLDTKPPQVVSGARPEPAPAKPKISRFKARRMGLED
ncbi:uri1, prefoldin-like chaperone [Coemansia spiralis]|nr:uri1, prefoldin-like chaperone [Coemansia spiralis]